MLRLLAVIVSVLGLAGCATSAGPFVTNISSDGANGLVVEKCMARFDPWMSTVSNDSCTQHTLKLTK
jgi:hypothetical protein